MVTIALASLLIGATILGRGKIVTRAVGVVLGSFIFRLVYTIALRFHLPGIHAQAGIFYHCRHCTIFPIFEDAAPNDEAPTNSFKK